MDAVFPADDKPDAMYARRPWSMPKAGWANAPNQVQGPFTLNDDRVQAERLMSELAATSQPRSSQLFRPRFGYLTNVPGIVDVIHVDERWQEPMPVDHWSMNGYDNHQSSSMPQFGDGLGRT